MTHAFVPEHLLAFAKYLHQHDFSDENYDLQCIHRTIVNRSYASTYLHTKEWIITNGPYLDVKDYADGDIGYHAAILVALSKLGKHKSKALYENFIKLRVAADYDIVAIISSDDAKNAIKLAEDICNALN